MVDTVLAGPDGRTSAIDAITGAPLTMEMMMRRRGLVTTEGAGSLMDAARGQQTASPGTVQPGADNANAATPSAASVVTGAASGLPPGAAPPLSVDGKAPPPVAGAPTDDSDNNILMMLAQAGVVGAAAYNILKQIKSGSAVPPVAGPGAVAVPASNPQQPNSPNNTAVGAVRARQRGRTGSFGADDITDAEYRVVGDDPALSAPQRKLPGNSNQLALPSTAKALAARNNPTGGVPMVAEPGQIGVPANDPEGISGVLRTLGIRPDMVDDLAANPGLLQTLRRIRR